MTTDYQAAKYSPWCPSAAVMRARFGMMGSHLRDVVQTGQNTSRDLPGRVVAHAYCAVTVGARSYRFAVASERSDSQNRRPMGDTVVQHIVCPTMLIQSSSLSVSVHAALGPGILIVL